MKKILIIGIHGSGKTTLGKLIANHYKIPFISSGEILREYAEKDQEIKSYLDKKEYVPDSIINRIIEEVLKDKDGFVLEGYPRTIDQVNYFEKICEVDIVLNLIVDEKLAIERLLYRMVCPVCKENYNKKLKPPKNDEVCDKCNVKLEKRVEDDEDGIKKRIENFKKYTLEVIEYYRKKDKVRDLDVNENDIQKVFEKAIALLSQ